MLLRRNCVLPSNTVRSQHLFNDSRKDAPLQKDQKSSFWCFAKLIWGVSWNSSKSGHFSHVYHQPGTRGQPTLAWSKVRICSLCLAHRQLASEDGNIFTVERKAELGRNILWSFKANSTKYQILVTVSTGEQGWLKLVKYSLQVTAWQQHWKVQFVLWSCSSRAASTARSKQSFVQCLQ